MIKKLFLIILVFLSIMKCSYAENVDIWCPPESQRSTSITTINATPYSLEKGSIIKVSASNGGYLTTGLPNSFDLYYRSVGSSTWTRFSGASLSRFSYQTTKLSNGNTVYTSVSFKWGDFDYYNLSGDGGFLRKVLAYDYEIGVEIIFDYKPVIVNLGQMSFDISVGNVYVCSGGTKSLDIYAGDECSVFFEKELSKFNIIRAKVGNTYDAPDCFVSFFKVSSYSSSSKKIGTITLKGISNVSSGDLCFVLDKDYLGIKVGKLYVVSDQNTSAYLPDYKFIWDGAHALFTSGSLETTGILTLPQAPGLPTKTPSTEYRWLVSTDEENFTVVNSNNASSISPGSVLSNFDGGLKVSHRPNNTTYYREQYKNECHSDWTTLEYVGKKYFTVIVPMSGSMTIKSSKNANGETIFYDAEGSEVAYNRTNGTVYCIYGHKIVFNAETSGGEVDSRKSSQWGSNAKQSGVSFTTSALTNTTLSTMSAKIFDSYYTNGVSLSNSIQYACAPKLSASISGSNEIISGNSATLTCSPTGGLATKATRFVYTYNWTIDGQSTSLGTGKTLNVSPSTTTKYKCTVSCNGETTSATYTVTVYGVLKPGAPSVKGSKYYYYPDESAVLSLPNLAGGKASSLTYQWQKYSNGTWLNYVTGANPTVGGDGWNSCSVRFRCLVSDGLQSNKESAEITLTWYAPVTASLGGGGVTKYDGIGTDLSCTAEGGDGSYSYQWYKDNTAINNAKNASYTVPGGSGSHTYKCYVSDGTKDVYTSASTVACWPALTSSISITGGNTVNTEDKSATLTCSAGGGSSTNYSFQWYQDGNKVGTNSSTYTVPGGSGSHNYTCVVSQSGSTSKTSNSVSVSCYTKLSASISCTSSTLYYGQSATLTCNVTSGAGRSPYTYIWTYNNETVSTTNTCIANKNVSGTYTCVVTDANGVKLTKTQSVTWWPKVTSSVTSSQAGSSLKSGASATLVCTAGGGDGKYSFAWQECVDGGNWTSVSVTPTNSGNKSTIVIPGKQPSSKVKYSYRCIVSVGNSVDKVTGVLEGGIFWEPAPTVNIVRGDGTNRTLYPNETITLTANASGGNGNYTYQWYEDGVKINGATSKEYIAGGSGYYGSGITNLTHKYDVVVVSNGAEGSYSKGVAENRFPITWYCYPSFAINPSYSGDTLCYNNNSTTLSVSYQGGSSSYNSKWEYQEEGSSVWSNVSGSDNTSSIDIVNLKRTTIYRCRVKDANNPKEAWFESSTVTIPVYTDMVLQDVKINSVSMFDNTITIPFGDSIIIGGEEPKGGVGNYGYKWQYSYDGTNWTSIETGDTLKDIKVSPEYNIYYHRIDTDKCQSKVLPQITVAVGLYGGKLQSKDTTICYGGTFDDILNVTEPKGGNQNYSYKWKFIEDTTAVSGNMFDVSGVANTESTLKGYPLTKSTWFVRYVYLANNTKFDAYSDTLKVRVRDEFKVQWPENQTVCFGEETQLSTIVPTGGMGDYRYDWKSNYSDTYGQTLSTEASYRDNNLNTSTYTSEGKTIYTMQVYDGCENPNGYGYKEGNMTVTQRQQSKLSKSYFDSENKPSSVTIDYGNTGSLLLYNSGKTGGSSDWTYAWQYKSLTDADWTAYNNSNNISFSIEKANFSDTTFFRLTAKDNVCVNELTSDTLTLNVRSFVKPVINNGSGQSICYNSPAQTLVMTTKPGQGTYSYLWYKKGVSDNDYVLVEGYTADSLSFNYPKQVNLTNDTYYKVKVSLSDKSIESDPYLISVLDDVTPGAISLSATGVSEETTIDAGNSSPSIVSSSESAGGKISSSNRAYSWYSKSESGTPKKIDGASGSTYNPGKIAKTTSYYRVAVDACGEKQSNTVKIVVNNFFGDDDNDDEDDDNNNPGGNSGNEGEEGGNDSGGGNGGNNEDEEDDGTPKLNGGKDQYICYNTVPEKITISNLPKNKTYKYTWYKKTVDENLYEVIEGKTASSLTFANNSKNRLTVSTYYKVALTAGGQTVELDPILVNVLEEVLPGEIAIGTKKLETDSVYYGMEPSKIFSLADAEGGSLADDDITYEWYKKEEGESNFVLIEDAYEADYQPERLTVTTSFYRLVVDECSSVKTNEVTFVVRESNFKLQDYKERYCAGEKASATVTGTKGTTFKWFNLSDKLVETGETFVVDRLMSDSTIVLRAYDESQSLVGENIVKFQVVTMEPDFSSSKLLVETGEAIYFINNSKDYENVVWDFGDGSDLSYDANPWHYFNAEGTFNVKLTLVSAEGCKSELEKKSYITVFGEYKGNIGSDIDGTEKSSIKVYPNPVSDNLTVESSDVCKLVLYNEVNKAIYMEEFNGRTSIEMSEYPEGVYILSVESRDNTEKVKVVKY